MPEQRNKQLLRFAAVLLVIATCSFHAHAANYDFTRVAIDTDFGPGSLNQTTSATRGFDFNNAGTMVFGVSAAGQTRLYTGSGGPLSLVAADNPTGPTPNYLSSAGASINDSGVVAYWKQTPGPGTEFVTRGIYTSGGATIYAAAINALNPVAPERWTDINNYGEVAFWIDAYYFTDDATILKGSGGATTTIASMSNNGFNRIDPHTFSINEFGAVAFLASNPGTLNGVFAGNGGALTTIYAPPPIGQPSGHAYSAPSINNAGNVAFDVLGGRVFVGDGSPPVPPWAANVGPLEDYPTINDAGAVAYLHNGDGGEIAIGLGASSSRVVGAGDALDGSTVQYLSYSNINNQGQVAFAAFLADGRTGLYIASPVPEPASILLAVLASPTLLWFGYRRRPKPGQSHKSAP